MFLFCTMTWWLRIVRNQVVFCNPTPLLASFYSLKNRSGTIRAVVPGETIECCAGAPGQTAETGAPTCAKCSYRLTRPGPGRCCLPQPDQGVTLPVRYD